MVETEKSDDRGGTKHLILGGARSGKSRFAEQLAIQIDQQSDDVSKLLYLATGTAEDSEMQERINHHKNRRSNQWQLREEPIHIAKFISELDSESTLLIDCLTLWISNCLHQQCWPEQRKAFIKELEKSEANIVMVSNEVGTGIVPLGALSREFVDESGRLHQQLAQICDQVSLVVAGLPIKLKDSSKDVSISAADRLLGQ